MESLTVNGICCGQYGIRNQSFTREVTQQNEKQRTNFLNLMTKPFTPSKFFVFVRLHEIFGCFMFHDVSSQSISCEIIPATSQILGHDEDFWYFVLYENEGRRH